MLAGITISVAYTTHPKLGALESQVQTWQECSVLGCIAKVFCAL